MPCPIILRFALVASGLTRQLHSVAADAFVGQKDDEARALTRGALHLDLAVVRLHNPGDETEAEAEALFGGGQDQVLARDADVHPGIVHSRNGRAYAVRQE